MYRRCRFTDVPILLAADEAAANEEDKNSWPIDPELDYLCSPDGQGLMECPADRFCREPADANLPSTSDTKYD